MKTPDFTGTWRFNPAKSLLQIPPPDSTIFVIEHLEPYFHLERTHVVGPTSDTFTIDLIADGQPVRKRHGDIDILARMYWENEVLVFHSELKRGTEAGTNIVRYHLADQGHTFTALEEVRMPEHTHTNKWVFDRE